MSLPRDATSHGKINPGFLFLSTGKAGNVTLERGAVFGGRSDRLFGPGCKNDVRDCGVIRRKRRPGDAILEASSSSNSQPLSSCWATTAESPTMPLLLQFKRGLHFDIFGLQVLSYLFSRRLYCSFIESSNILFRTLVMLQRAVCSD